LFRIEEKEVSILFYSITVTEFVSFFVFQFGSVPVCLCSRSLLVSMVTWLCCAPVSTSVDYHPCVFKSLVPRLVLTLCYSV